MGEVIKPGAIDEYEGSYSPIGPVGPGKNLPPILFYN